MEEKYLEDYFVKMEDFFVKMEKCIADEEKNAKDYGTKFNVFEILGVSKKEVYMCRMITELLDPKGNHYQGDKYLKFFFKTINRNHNFNIENLPSKNVQVKKEEILDKNKNYRRIDITIDDQKTKRYIPIEVKIHACDQKNQCRDYLKKARDRYNEEDNARLLYLTKYGNVPSDESLGETPEEIEKTKKLVICISWQNDIIAWIDNCKNKTPKNAIPIIKILEQLKEAIKSFLNNESGAVMNKEIAEYIKENYALAVKIKEDIDIVMKNLWIKFYNKIKPAVDNLPSGNGVKYTSHPEWNINYYANELHLNISATSEGHETRTGRYNVSINEYKINDKGKEEDTKEIFSSQDLLSVFADDNALNEKVEKYVSEINKYFSAI